MFLDEVRIEVVAGKGGDGVVHFRREKYVPRGGPDGGDGGRGGHVVLRVRRTMHALSWFRQKRSFLAEAGRNGGSSNKAGRQGKDLVLPVPPGTLVRTERDGEVLADLTQAGDEVLVARGGSGATLAFDRWSSAGRVSVSFTRTGRAGEAEGGLGRGATSALTLDLLRFRGRLDFTARLGAVLETGVKSAGDRAQLHAVAGARFPLGF